MTSNPTSPMIDVVTTMPFDDLEQAYECLAQAIDRAGPHHEALFLTRLALVLAHHMGNLETFKQSVGTALADLADSDG